jgi:glycosyltransferase involved in cell wall biosynthesis
MSSPLVSVVVTTKNEEKNMEACLLSIRQQSYAQDRLEIIVVDNYSTDKTLEVSRKYTDNIHKKGPERSAQRNYGILEIACGDYVMFVDADMILSPLLIARCVETIEGGKCIALHVPEIVLGQQYLSRVRRFERSFYDGTVVDGARFFKKEIFEQVKGFDETMSGPEDWDIDKKIKKYGRIGLVSRESPENIDWGFWSLSGFVRERGVSPEKQGSVIYHNEAEFDLSNYLRKKWYYSQDLSVYIAKWGANDPDVKKQLGFAYRYFGVFVEMGKWKKLILNPSLAMGMYFLRILVGFLFLVKLFNKKK